MKVTWLSLLFIYEISFDNVFICFHSLKYTLLCSFSQCCALISKLHLLSFKITGEVLGALCSMKGTGVFVACCDEILKNVGENLERRLPDPEEVAEGLVHKLTGSEKETGEEKVNN